MLNFSKKSINFLKISYIFNFSEIVYKGKEENMTQHPSLTISEQLII